MPGLSERTDALRTFAERTLETIFSAMDGLYAETLSVTDMIKVTGALVSSAEYRDVLQEVLAEYVELDGKKGHIVKDEEGVPVVVEYKGR